MSDSFSSFPTTRQTSKSFALSDTPAWEKYIKSSDFARISQIYNKERDLPDPCGKGELSKINIALKKFFTALKGIKEYGELYINGSINKISNITNLIKSTSKIIASVLKSLISRLRDFLIDKIRKALDSVLDSILPTVAKQYKNTTIQLIIDQIFCSFKDIISNLLNLVIDFLNELIGKIINVPFCATQQFVNALINNLAAIIDKTLGPILDQVNDILGGVGKIVGSVFEAIDYILGFESFLCAAPNCPELKEFKAGPWGGPSSAQIDTFNNFAKVPTAEGIVGKVDDYISNIEIFGDRLGDASSPSSSITECDADAYRCGPPKILIFGGGGIGAVGEAVIDNIGRTIGVSLLNRGSGYKRPPFVSFVDNCATTFTSGYAVIDDNPDSSTNGQIIDIVMTNIAPSAPADGKDEYDYTLLGSLVDSSPTDGGLGTGAGSGGDGSGSGGDGSGSGGDGSGSGGDGSGSGGDNKITDDYIVCLNGFTIVNTGTGYTENDSIQITPDIPGLNAVVSLTEFGQIIDIQITEEICGITEYPDIVIDSNTGGEGVVIRPNLTFTKVLEDVPEDSGLVLDKPITTLRGRQVFTENLRKQGFTRKSVVRIVDCVN